MLKDNRNLIAEAYNYKQFYFLQGVPPGIIQSDISHINRDD